MFKGLRTHLFAVPRNDLSQAKTWYSKLFGRAPYFDELFYVGFNVAGFEFGLDPTDEKVTVGDNVYTYWGVDDVEEALAHCVRCEAEVFSEIQEVGEGIRVALIRDPFGNILGLIQNPNFKAD